MQSKIYFEEYLNNIFMLGKIRVHIVSADITHDVKKIGKMDPYVRV